jgi:hypothetical protein
MIRTRNLILNLTPVEVTLDDEVDASNSISIQNTSLSKFVYVGGSTVSPSNYGYRLSPNQTITIDLDPYDKVYAMGESESTVAILIVDKT